MNAFIMNLHAPTDPTPQALPYSPTGIPNHGWEGEAPAKATRFGFDVIDVAQPLVLDALLVANLGTTSLFI